MSRADWHQIMICGCLGRDPELRVIPSGTHVCDFSVAVNEYWGSGEKQGKRTTWYQVTVWEGLAAVCAQYLNKGSRVLVVGRPRGNEFGRPNCYETKNGNHVADFDVVATTVKFLGSGNGEEFDGIDF